MPFLILSVLLVIGFLVAFAIGSNDETMAPAVGARVFSVKTAVILGAVINLFGALFLGAGVSEKVGSELIGGSQEPLTTTMVLAILVSMAIWLLLASITKGLPISTTQCIVGSVIGVVTVAPFLGQEGWGVGVIDWLVVVEILSGWIISPIIGFIISALVFKAVRRLQKRAKGLKERERQEVIAAYGLALFLIITSMSRGGNDVANAVAPLIALPEFEGSFAIGNFIVPMASIPLVIGGLGMGLGLIIVGRKVIKNLATEVVTLSPTSALSASISVSIIMFIGTLLGLPLSGTHVLVAALIAVGWVTETPVKRDQVKDILISWVITVPISVVFAFFFYAAFYPFL